MIIHFEKIIPNFIININFLLNILAFQNFLNQ